jgi:hypothetical protein
VDTVTTRTTGQEEAEEVEAEVVAEEKEACDDVSRRRRCR